MMLGRFLVLAVAVTGSPHSQQPGVSSRIDAALHHNRVSWTRAKSTGCSAEIPPSPAVRLASLPDTGTTWLQYLFEEITHIATQNPQSVPQVDPLEPYVLTNMQVTLRAQCGAQLLQKNCTSEAWDALGMHLAHGDELEIFKSHYPVPTARTAMFETDPPIAKTLVLIRNPIDSFLAHGRHMLATDPNKVGSVEFDSFLAMSPHRMMDHVDSKRHDTEMKAFYAQMRPSTIGIGFDPRHLLETPPYEDNFQNFLEMWVDFVRFWASAVAVNCTEVTFVRYEDLCDMNLIEDALEELLSITGMVPVTEDAVERAVEKFSPDLSRLGSDVYFNKTVALDTEVAQMIAQTIKAKIHLLDTFGYRQFLDDLWTSSLPAIFG